MKLTLLRVINIYILIKTLLYGHSIVIRSQSLFSDEWARGKSLQDALPLKIHP